MVRIDRLREDSEKRILRCSEGKSIWYQIWIDPGDMMRIEPLLEGGNRLWCIEIQKYYVFFYEVRNSRRIIGKNKIKEILDILLQDECQGCFYSLASLYVVSWYALNVCRNFCVQYVQGFSGYALNTKA